MNGAKIQAKIDYGYGKAAKVIGTDFNIYRSASMINPLDSANLVKVIKASFTPTLTYGSYNKPNAPLWTAVIDGSTLLAGDWISNGALTFYLADKQALLPYPAVQCSTTVNITRPTYSSGSGPYEASELTIASDLPVFMFNKKDKTASPHWSPVNTDSVVSTPEWEFYINTRTEGDIQSKDIITDKLGTQYIVETNSFTSFGYIVSAKLAKP
jgi:hypothetical protein